jgi:hypothetical protein
MVISNVAVEVPQVVVMVLVIVYVPGRLLPKLICPVVILANRRLGEEAENTPALEPGGNTGVVDPSLQYATLG